MYISKVDQHWPYHDYRIFKKMCYDAKKAQNTRNDPSTDRYIKGIRWKRNTLRWNKDFWYIHSSSVPSGSSISVQSMSDTTPFCHPETSNSQTCSEIYQIINGSWTKTVITVRICFLNFPKDLEQYWLIECGKMTVGWMR